MMFWRDFMMGYGSVFFQLFSFTWQLFHVTVFSVTIWLAVIQVKRIFGSKQGSSKISEDKRLEILRGQFARGGISEDE